MSYQYIFRWSVVVLPLMLVGTACAQSNSNNVDSLREVKRIATETFLDSSMPTARRLRAAENLGYPEDSTFVAMLRIGTDKSEDDAIRLVALKKHRYDEGYFKAVLAIVADKTESGALVSGLIDDISRRTTFRQPAEMRQQLQEAFRSVLDDSRPAVRLSAYRTLVSAHDAAAIDRLVESLRSGQNIPIPLPDAIGLLDVDGSTKHIGTLRPYLENPDPAVQEQVARALAVDPQSRQVIVGLANNIETPVAVRVNALRALSREDEEFMSYATRLVSNRKEKPNVRYEAMRSGMGRLNYQGETASIQVNFALAVEQLSGEQGVVTTDKRDVGAEAKELLAFLRRNFPAVRRYFLQRG